ncbi:MAG TPA: peptidyl-prolyl cis-trans isomerase [Pyrinomonadaceae bacterium]|nr:peptidyl-prolyl cis-trans isomerase [Pyrinomonadaceae bacterium]
MLRQLSRLEKTRNFLLLTVVILMAVSLVIFYAPSRTENQQVLTRSQETLATVGSDSISVGDIATEQENKRRQYEQMGMAQYAPPVKGILEQEINSRLVRQEAARLNLTPTDEEVATEIRRQLKTAKVDTTDVKKYQQLVTENFGSVERFEQSIRDTLAEQKVRAYLTSGVSVSEEEVLDEYRRNNTTFELVYVPVTAPQVAEKLNPSDDELRNYFEQNKALFRIDEPQKKVRYVFINQSKVGEKLNIPEAEIRSEYDALPADKKLQGIAAQQIVLKVGDPSLEAKVLEKANNLLTEARKDGGKISEEAFATLARGNSEDPATASNGGKLRGLVRENKNKPDDPYQRVLTLEPGDVTEPIKSGNSYYILRRGEAVPKSFEDAKQEILISLRNRRAYKSAADLAQRAAERLKETKDVRKVADELAAQANMKPDEMVRETGFIKVGDDVPNIGNSPQFEEGIAPLNNVGDVGERTQIKDGFAIPLLVDKQEPRDKTFEEAKDQVLAAYKLDNAKTRLEQVARDVANSANSVDTLKAAAERAGLKASDAKDYKLGSPLGEAGISATSASLDDAIYNLKPGEITKTPIKAGDNWFVVGLAKRNEASSDEFAKQRDQLIQSMYSVKKGQIFSDYLADLRRRLEKDGRIKINKDAMAKLEAKPEETELPS